MDREFHRGNRQRMYDSLKDGTIALIFSGHAPRKTQDENYPFYANRNFVYLTGIEREGFILMAEKQDGETKEIMFILPPDFHAERWTGRRMKADQVTAISGIRDVRYVTEFDEYLYREIRKFQYSYVALDLYKHDADEEDPEAFHMAARIHRELPYVHIETVTHQLMRQRTIKQPCEIEAIRNAVHITKAGILAMMKASKPDMYEYQLKAEFDYALAQKGVLAPAFPSIISSGENNFCIHYYDYLGQIKSGDMILVDVGGKYDNLFNDVSRGWPVDGKFTERQKILYTCAYNTSQHMFEIIRPGMPMEDVDRLAREYNYEQLHAAGVCDAYANIGTYMWHGGAHHVGYDVHDLVNAVTVEPGMVFCVDIGIYHEEWGIGFRLEDNCLVTPDGCENLTAAIPRSIEEIEAVLAEREN